MSTKNIIRSIRMTDEMLEAINDQTGATFQAKFENMVTRCIWELPAKEALIEQAEKSLEAKREQLKELNKKYMDMEAAYRRISDKLDTLNWAIEAAINSIT